MSNKVGHLHFIIDDYSYRISTNRGQAKYTLNGIPTFKMGDVDSLPDKVVISDHRSLPSAMNAPVEAKPTVEDKIREIVSGYVTGELYEFEDELVDELKTLFRQEQQETDAARMAELVNSAVSDRIRKELLPGGLLYSR